MSLTQASDTENMQVKINSSDKQSKNGDEKIEGMSVSDVPEFTDPAILVVRENVKIRYTREELMKLRDVPLSKKNPDFFDASEVSPSILDLERWNFDRKKSDTPPENGPRAGDISEHRRRPGDPRERIRKENDGIVLSPQRRSFNSGCFVPVRDTTRTNRPHSPLGGKNEPSHIGVREIQSGTRRIGSGRILRDSWDFNEKSESGDNDYSFRGQQRNADRDDKYERRSFGRDFEINRDREGGGKEGRRNGRYERRRISENREQEEPEWFSGGPLSQADTIELRGFDESEKPTSKKKLSPSRVRRAKEWSKKKNEAQAANANEEKEEPKETAGRPSPAPQACMPAEQPQQAEKLTNEPAPSATESIEPENKASSLVGDQSFNFEDILKCDTIPGLLTNGVGGDGDNMKSRFSRWFKQESPEKVDSRRSSMHDDHHIIKDLLNDIGETSVSIPNDSDAYFAPISPAGNSGGVIGGKRNSKPASQPINIMEMLQRGKQQAEGGAAVKPPQMSGKILSLDELEAKMRQNIDASASLPQKYQKQKPDEETTAAFKKLLAQAQAGGHPVTSNGPMNKTQPMSLLEMLNHSQQQDEAARMSAGANPHLLGATNSTMGGIHHHPNDLSLKLQQAQFQQQQQQKQQMEMLNKLINATVHPPQMRTSPLHDIGMQQSRELLSRPEAQAILQAMHQRIPSPRELQVHTQNILQRALIKKKLEEQQENYRKKQEMQRGQSPNTNAGQGPAKSVSSPTPLAFTPTSVLRKMTADKDEGKENKATADGKAPPGRAVTGMRPQPAPPQAQQWSSQFSSVKQPAGRPIVKASNNYQSQTAEQFFSQQQQQRMFGQPLPGTIPQQTQQQRKAPTSAQFGGNQASNGPGGPQSTYNPQYSTNQQFAQQLTQQQLRAQHQHRPANQSMQQHHQGQHQQGYQQHQGSQHMGATWQQFFNSTHQANRNANPVGRGGVNDGDLSPTTTNQLARWFSPDLLERARVGELPSTAGLGQHALSLEEIERQTAPPVHN